MKRYKITVVGTGYVGMSLATLLGQRHIVYVKDVVDERIDMINSCASPIHDEYINKYLQDGKSKIRATLDSYKAYAEAEYVIVAVPTNYDPTKNSFDTSIVEQVIEEIIHVNNKAYIIIKSTVPVGFTEKMREAFNSSNILFSPEFLRESKALYDNLHPLRIIIGADLANKSNIKMAEEFVKIMADVAIEDNIPQIIMGIPEAEAVKLFSNTYLAMRVAYFNELDTYCSSQQILDTKLIFLVA